MIWIEKGFVVVCWRDFFFIIILSQLTAVDLRGGEALGVPKAVSALLPSGHGERAVARVAGKAPAADRLSQTAASDALSPKANSSSVCLRRLTFNPT